MQLAKGMRDLSGSEMIIREQLTEMFRKTFTLYGFRPLQTPIVERMDVLHAKFAAGEDADIATETFRVTDQGKRDLGLRFDLTVPMARFVAMNPQLKFPFKRYQIGRVFRDGPIKLGRYRELWQYDIDIVGLTSMQAEADLLTLGVGLFDQLGIDVKFKVNNRKLLQSVIVEAGVKKEDVETVIISVDKLDKIGNDGVKKELSEKSISGDVCDAILEKLSVKGSAAERLAYFKENLKDTSGAEELEELFALVDSDKIVFDPSLARGLAYYTGTVFEAFMEGFGSSLAGGGRYDDMIGKYSGKGDVAAVGLSFGFEPIMDMLLKLEKVDKNSSNIQLYVIPIGDVNVRKIAQELRGAGISLDIGLSKKGTGKNIKYAAGYNIPYVLLAGEDEIKEGKYALRDVKSGKEEKLSLEGVFERLM